MQHQISKQLTVRMMRAQVDCPGNKSNILVIVDTKE